MPVCLDLPNLNNSLLENLKNFESTFNDDLFRFLHNDGTKLKTGHVLVYHSILIF